MSRLLKILLFCFVFGISYFVFPKPQVWAAGWCWCTGPDAAGNQCARTTPPPGASCAAPGPVNNDATGGFNVCCSDPAFYSSTFTLTSPVCGSSSEILPACATTPWGSLVCYGNDFASNQPDVMKNLPREFNSELTPAQVSQLGSSFSFGGGSYTTTASVYVCGHGNYACGIEGSTGGATAVPDPGAPGGPPAPVPLCAGQFPGDPDPNTCYYDGTLSRPGGSCKERVPYVNSNLEQYTLSCAVTPEINLNYKTCDQEEFNEVVIGYNGQMTGCSAPDCYINMRLLVNFGNLQLGGLGPSAYNPNSPDSLAKTYPYSGLADKPLYIDDFTAKESFRTWWRLQPLINQLNAKAAFLKRADQEAGSLPAKFKQWLGGMVDLPIFKEAAFPYFSPGTPPPTVILPSPPPTNEDGSSGIGINIGYGHQADFFGQISSGKPTTFLVPMDSDIGTLQQYAALYSGSSPRIIRIIDIVPDDSAGYLQKIRELSQRLSSVFTSSSDIVVFGNELNDLKEYGCEDLANCGRIYTNQFLAFKSSLSGPRAATAPMNTSHAIRDAALFLGAATAAYQAADVTAHNTYQLGSCSYESIRCTTNSWSWEQQVTGTSGKPHIITEYGLNPAEADTLKVWIDWLVANPPSGITTILTPNLCPTAAGDWLEYIDPETIFDVNGQKVDPNCSPDDLESTPIQVSEFKLSELIGKLPTCLRSYPVCDNAQAAYNRLDDDTKAMYDAFQPFNFDNVRGYLGLSYIDASTNKLTAGVLAENLPYVQALKDILSDPAGGILTNISPDWLNTSRATTYTSDDFNATYPAEGELSFPDAGNEEKPNTTFVIDKAEAIWGKDLTCSVLKRELVKLSLPSPLTYPQKLPIEKDGYNQLPGAEYKDVLDQTLLTPVTVQILDPGDPANTCPAQTDENGQPILVNGLPVRERQYVAEMRGDESRDTSLPLRSKVGRTIAVLTNPKFTDFSRLIGGPLSNENPLYDTNLGSLELPSTQTNTGLYPLLLPSELALEENNESDQAFYGQSATYDSAHDPNFSSHRAIAGNSGDSTAPVPRKAGLAEILLCKIRNYWLRPSGLQAGSADQCADASAIASSTVPPPADTPETPGACMVKQHLFETTCGGEICYNYITAEAQRNSCSGRGVLNPALLIAIALNENGGLVSTQDNGYSPANLPHFGCFANNDSIEGKTSCATGTLRKCDLSDELILKRYGYVVGANYDQSAPLDAAPLNAILNVLNICSAAQATQRTPCFSVFVSASEAQFIASRIALTLASQRQTWFSYYQGYLNGVAATTSCTVAAP